MCSHVNDFYYVDDDFKEEVIKKFKERIKIGLEEK